MGGIANNLPWQFSLIQIRVETMFILFALNCTVNFIRPRVCLRLIRGK